MVKITNFPFLYGPEFEGERIRAEDLYIQFGGRTSSMVEWVTTLACEEITDGKIELFGPDIQDCAIGDTLPLAIIIEVAGKNMQPDFEPVLEKQIHRILNRTKGVMHTGQRDMGHIKVSKSVALKGFSLRHIGAILYEKLHNDYERIIDKTQVKIYTDAKKAAEILNKARPIYAERDARVEGITDEGVDTFYSCTICQSFFPFHVCTISPQRSSPCGSYSWLDCKAAYEIEPTGPNKPILKQKMLDSNLGQWQGINNFVKAASQGKMNCYNLYDIMEKPMPTSEWVECVSVVLPQCNGIMIADKDYNGMTPCGMDFKTIIDNIKGELDIPGFMGHSRYNIVQDKFIFAEGGVQRIVWMPLALKKWICDNFGRRGKGPEIIGMLDKIADESIGTDEESVLAFLKAAGHPALLMEAII
ncbi:MAG: hypothetical protein WC958_01585 [Dehalococcoidales bacterium]